MRQILFCKKNNSDSTKQFSETDIINLLEFYVTEYGTALTTILPILFLYLNTVTVTAGTFEP